MYKAIIIALSFFKSIFFNLRCLPFRQAILLPIFVRYDTKVTINGGKIKISIPAKQVKTAMIRIGFHEVPVKDSCRAILNIQGLLVFWGRAHIGNGSIISVKKNAQLFLGDNFTISACTAINCYKKISFGKDNLISWDCLVVDCDSHLIYDNALNVINQSKEIVVQDHVWIGCGSLILKGACIPSECVVAARSVVVAKPYESFSIIAGNPAKVVKKIGGWKL